MPPREPTVIERLMDVRESSLLDVLDHVLNKGVMATGDLTLGVAGVDLVYIRLSALLCAADRVLASEPPPKAPSRPARRSKPASPVTPARRPRRRSAR